MEIQAFWNAVITQDRDALAAFFTPDAEIRWPCTNERFTLPEYLRANCEYPGRWEGELDRTELTAEGFVLAGRVWPSAGGPVNRVTSFCRLEEGKIRDMEEYWAEDAPPPAWRREMGIGRPIR